MNGVEHPVNDASKISLKTKAAYGLGAFGKDFAVSIIFLFLMFYYTDIVGLSAAFVGTLFLLVRGLDAITDPIMGMIVDNTRSRFGQFRPWILIGTVLNSVFLLALFATHWLGSDWLIPYVTITYILWGITYTIMDIPFWSMVPAISNKRSEREKLVVWPRFFASFAWMLVGSYGLWAVDTLAKDDRGQGFFLLSGLIVISFIFSSLITVLFVREQDSSDAKHVQTSEKFSFKDIANIVKTNDQLRVLFVVVLCFIVATQIAGGVAIYYFTYAIGREDLFATFMLASGIAEMTGIFLCPKLCEWLPRKRMWVIACLSPMLCSAILAIAAFVAPTNIWLVGFAGAALKFGLGLSNVLSTVMLADVVDYGEYKTGKRTASIIFSVQTMLVKSAGALASFFIGVGLAAVGYIANAEQSAQTIWGIRALMMLLPFCLLIASAIVYRKYYRLHEGFDVNAHKHG